MILISLALRFWLVGKNKFTEQLLLNTRYLIFKYQSNITKPTVVTFLNLIKKKPKSSEYIITETQRQFENVLLEVNV